MAVLLQANTTIEDMAARMRTLDDFVICGHVSPDGDCIGSQLALWNALRAIGKRATCVLVRDEPTPMELSFLPGIEQMVPAQRFNGLSSTFVACDVPSRARMGEAACAILDASSQSFTIDHHPSEGPVTDYLYADSKSASASILVWQLVKYLVEEPPYESALCAFTGLVTDTGGFRYQNSDENAFRIAGELVSWGVDPSMVCTHVFQNRSLASLELEAATIRRIKLIGDGAAAISYVLVSDFEKTGATKADAEPLVEALRSLSGVRVVCMLREQDGVVRGSLRAKDDTDVSELARELGGGGHTAAAGFTLELSIEHAVEMMAEKLSQIVEDGAC